MSVYRNDNPDHFREAIASISTHQTLKPDEIILVVDGPVPQYLSETIHEVKNSDRSIKVIWLKENVGLGNALRTGLEHTTFDIVARMDSDDISMSDRFEKQMRIMMSEIQPAILGAQISEFINDPDNIVGHRCVPVSDRELKTYLKSRCPFNHMSVMFRKNAVMRVGSYIDWHFNEDYFLWIRLAKERYLFANSPDTLVNVRVGNEMYARRGGAAYFRSEKKLQDYMLRHHLISHQRYLYNIIIRFIVQVAMPNSIRGFVFRKLFRKQ